MATTVLRRLAKNKGCSTCNPPELRRLFTTLYRPCRGYDSVKISERAYELIRRGTPLVHLQSVTKGLDATIVAKQEMFLPTASNKDRPALYMIENAEKRGQIIPGKTTLVEPTSGNMGIGLAFMATLKGYEAVITLPEDASLERKIATRAFGAKLVLTPKELGVQGAIKKAEQIRDSDPEKYVMLGASTNPFNRLAHYDTTGPEIWEGTDKKIDMFVMGVGSGGTMSGTSMFIKEMNPKVQIYALEPAECVDGQPCHHGIAGIGAAKGSKLVDWSLLEEEILKVSTEEAMAMSRRLAREEGLLVGIVSGANTVAAIRLAQRPENRGKLIVTMHTSYGERYFSSDLYKEIREEVQNQKPEPVDPARIVPNCPKRCF
ncbi:Cysteine synthase [Melia azedarach]|uniref:Cysteine synthase n=1 Tax=Melia azedarach TaxID=155640 RepID=A0ACC1YX27_MELAZ|nr:Cysteine synthase [Melia azedarach]